ncbi:MAG: thiamine phosphate synthase, partial [Planctomycetota bacterium]
MPAVARLIDANANRAREALRVMEDAARFLLNDADLSADLKTLRHDLAAALTTIPNLTANRDTPGDVGTTLTTPREHFRGSVADVAVAAGKRLSEALRSIEEFTKTLPLEKAAAASQVEQLRYRGYELERRLNAALRPTARRQWRLCVLLTESLCRLPWKDVLDQVLDAGV